MPARGSRLGEERVGEAEGGVPAPRLDDGFDVVALRPPDVAASAQPTREVNALLGELGHLALVTAHRVQGDGEVAVAADRSVEVVAGQGQLEALADEPFALCSVL